MSSSVHPFMHESFLGRCDALAPRRELLGPRYRSSHFSPLVCEAQVLLQGSLRPQGGGHALDLFLRYLLGLCVVEVVELQLQVSPLLDPVLTVLLEYLLLCLAHKCKVAIRVEVVVRLQQDDVLATSCLFRVKAEDSLEILLLKVLFLELEDHQVTLLHLAEPLTEHSQVDVYLL